MHPNSDDVLIQTAVACTHDPSAFVRFAFDSVEPHAWQLEIMDEIGRRLKAGESTTYESIQIAIASGHGIGKSCLVSWLILWAMATCSDTKCVVTANTENQLKTKTWAELSKWHNLCAYKSWFTLTATALISAFDSKKLTWRADQIAWSERNTEAFAGLHNAGRRVLLIMDEASGIPNNIWDVSRGALTDEDTEIIWLAFGNPTRNLGAFSDCFGKLKHRWINKKIDSRSVPGTNKKQIDEWAQDYGEDSDFFRVRVRGEFPSASANSLLGPDDIDASMSKQYPPGSQDHAAIILGVDVARQGDDSSAIATRRGMCMSPIRMMRIPDTMLVASQVSQEISRIRADACFVDESGGYGAGVVDALRQINQDPIGVQFAGKPLDPRYFNKRSEMYFELAKWVKNGGQLPVDEELKEELCATEYRFVGDKFRIVDKDEIKSILGRSPDKADAAALTFAYPVVPKTSLFRYDHSRNKEKAIIGHNPF